MEQILLAYGIPKETVAAITILYRNTKVKVRSPDGDTEYFDIVAGVLQGDTLAPYLFIICLDYVLRTSIDKIKENGFELTKKRSRRYPATTITDADYADDIAILANTPDQAETLLHSLERTAASIGLHVNAHKTEYMCYNQTGDISTLEGTPLKLVDKFTYLGSSVESTEKDIETRLTKAWRAPVLEPNTWMHFSIRIPIFASGALCLYWARSNHIYVETRNCDEISKQHFHPLKTIDIIDIILGWVIKQVENTHFKLPMF